MSRVEDMWEEYESGKLSLRAVGANHGISGERVRQLLTESGYVTRSRGEARQLRRQRMRDTAELVREELHNEHVEEGHSVREIARTRHLTVEAVKEALFG